MTGLPGPAALGLAEGDLVLDIGCAGGRGTLALGGLGYRVIGVELLATLLEEMRTTPETKALTACQADATALPMPSGSVKGVFLIEVLEHIPDTAGVLREVRRVLAGDGRACIAVPTGYTERLYGRLHPRYSANAEHVHVFSRARLERLVADAGMRVVEVRTTNLGPAIAWSVHALIRTDADPTGRVLRHGWIDTAVSGMLWGLRRVPGARAGVAALDRRFGKSWYFHCAPA